MKEKIAIVDNSIDHRIYDPVNHWKKYLDIPWQAFRAKESCFPSLDEGYTHLILTGSEASILEREKWVYQEIDLVKDAIDKGLSVLGSCYGHQLLAMAILGSRCLRACPSPEVGWTGMQVTDFNPLFGEIDECFVFMSHFDEVVNLGEGFHVFASTDKCRVQAFQFIEKPVWGIQSHPEMNIQAGMDYLKAQISEENCELQHFKKALVSQPKDSGLISQIAVYFIHFAKGS